LTLNYAAFSIKSRILEGIRELVVRLANQLSQHASVFVSLAFRILD